MPFWKVINLNLSHLSLCMELDHIAMGGFWTEKQWIQELKGESGLSVGIMNYSNLIAVASGWLVVDELQIMTIGVHPENRKTGLGKFLITDLLGKAKTLGIKSASLEVSDKNPAALALYKSCGFKATGQRNNYYKDGSNAIIQYLALN